MDSTKIQADFSQYLSRSFLKNLTSILSLGIIILSYYMYSDWTVRHSISAVLTRVPAFILILSLFIIHVFYPKRYYNLKKRQYILIYYALQCMMYGKCLVHLHENALAPAVTGTVLIIFLISLDIKQDTKQTILIYGIPLLIFIFCLSFLKKPSVDEFYVLVDIFPIVFVGFFINRVQYKLRLKLFKSNYYLRKEQEKTRSLYMETLEMNAKLKRKANEALFIKKAIQEKNIELNKTNATKDKFIGIIAHDLKNPIGTVWGLSELMLTDETMEPLQQRECMEAICKSIKNTHELLENLLTWARAQNKAILFHPQELIVKEIVEKELNILCQMAAKKSIRIENRIPENFIVYADKNMFETIIRNLVTNAIKYTYAKDIIEVSSGVINPMNNFSYSEICITDHGVGMSEEKIANLFEITDKTSTRGTNNEDGTGLGLLLCKEFIEIHKGEIMVKSKINEGSSFICKFPLKSDKTKEFEIQYMENKE